MFGFGQLILFGPAIDLTAEIIAGLPKISQARRLNIGIVERRQRVDHGVIGLAPKGGRGARHRAVPDRAPINHAHHIEPAADHIIIGAQAIGAGNRKAGWVKTVDRLEFAVNGMCAGQQGAKGLAPQHIRSAFGVDAIGWV